MKKKILTVLLLLSTQVLSAPTETSDLLPNFEKINSSNIKKNFDAICDDIERFSEIKSLTKKDIDLTAAVLKTVVLFDQHDKSRTAAQMLTVSYLQNKNIYKQAQKKLSKADQKIVSDLFKMLEHLGSDGNG